MAVFSYCHNMFCLAAKLTRVHVFQAKRVPCKYNQLFKQIWINFTNNLTNDLNVKLNEIQRQGSYMKFSLLNGFAFPVLFRSSHPEVLLGKGVLKICSKFTGEHPCQSAIWIKLQNNFIEITPGHGCCPVNLLRNFNTPFCKNTSERLFLNFYAIFSVSICARGTLVSFCCWSYYFIFFIRCEI